jgi:SAM-dependent methyltransferase
VHHIEANNVLEHVPNLSRLMGNCLRLLATGGELRIEVPIEGAATAWQDPTHVRAMNENSWIYYTEWFWYLGWFEHRFELGESTYLDLSVQPCAREQAAFMRVSFRKVETTARERTTARTLQSELRVPEDRVLPHEMYAPSATPVDILTETRPTVVKLFG